MHHCDDKAGNFTVKFKCYDEGRTRFQIGAHAESPVLDTADDFVGSLCTHELDFIQGRPGKVFSPDYAFEVKPL